MSNLKKAIDLIISQPPDPRQPTLYGYNIEHLELIARVLRKEDLPPERLVEVLTDISRIVAIVKDEFEEELRKQLTQLPSEQLERPRGQWIPLFDGKFTGGAYWFECSNCKRIVPEVRNGGWNFCPSCGADMREEEGGKK